MPYTKPICLTFAGLIAFVLSVFAQTNVSGGIFSNTTWTAANSPYIVTDTIRIFQNVTLTIEPGVIVKVDSGRLIEVRGSIMANGAEGDSITFTSSSLNPYRGIHPGITFTITDTNSFQYCKFLYAQEALQGSTRNHNVKHCYFADNYLAIRGTPAIDSSYFERNFRAILGLNQSRLTNSVLTNNHGGVITTHLCMISNNLFTKNHFAISSYAWDSIVGNVIMYNDSGLVAAPAQNSKIINNTIAQNSIGIQRNTAGNNDDFYWGNKICNNSLYNFRTQTATNLDLTNNCWCSNDSSQIQSLIYDGYVDFNVGLVHFVPFLNCDTSDISTSNTNIEYTTGKFLLYPNPFQYSTQITFEVQKDKVYSLVIFDTQGRAVQTETRIVGDSVKIERQNLRNGLYFFQLRTDKQIVVNGKFIIE